MDIGCNIGHITLSVARDFGAKSVLGIDIDKNLIGIARKNTKYYVKSTDTSNDEMPKSDDVPKSNCEFFPISMPILYGPIDIPGFSGGNKRQFPHNVTFKQVIYYVRFCMCIVLLLCFCVHRYSMFVKLYIFKQTKLSFCGNTLLRIT